MEDINRVTTVHGTPCLLPKGASHVGEVVYREEKETNNGTSLHDCCPKLQDTNMPRTIVPDSRCGRLYIDGNDGIRMYLLKASECHRPIFWIWVSLYPIAAACDAAPDFITRQKRDAWERASFSHPLNWLVDIA